MMKKFATQMSFLGGSDMDLVEEKLTKSKKQVIKESDTSKKIYVDLSLLDNNPLNDKIYLDKDVEKLKTSIRNHGYLDSNIMCQQLANGRFLIISGHRRVRALKELSQEDPNFDKQYPITLADDSVNLLVDMNLSGRELEEVEKLNQIFFKVLDFKNNNESIVDIDIVRSLVYITGLGESQLKKYIRMFNALNYDLNQIQNTLEQYKSVNLWDKDRSAQAANHEKKFIVTKKVEEQFDGNKLFVKEPSKHFQTKLIHVIQQQDKLIKLLDELFKFKDLSKKGSISIQTILSKNKTIKSLLDDFKTE